MERVGKQERDGETVWVKRGVKDHRNLLQRIVFGLRGSARGELAREAASIRRMSARGALVPTILEESEHILILSDIGDTLEQILRRADAQTASALVTAAAKNLEALHRAGGWHGNAALRNMTLAQEGQIGLLDFDHGVPHGLPLLFKQAYDLWVMTASSFSFDPTGELAKTALAAYGYLPVTAYIKRSCRPLGPFSRALWPIRASLGRDIRRVLEVMRVLQGVPEFGNAHRSTGEGV